MKDDSPWLAVGRCRPSEVCGLRENNLFHEGGDDERDNDDEGREIGADRARWLYMLGSRGVGGKGFINFVAGSIVLKSSAWMEFADALRERDERSTGTKRVLTVWPGIYGHMVVQGIVASKVSVDPSTSY